MKFLLTGANDIKQSVKQGQMKRFRKNHNRGTVELWAYILIFYIGDVGTVPSTILSYWLITMQQVVIVTIEVLHEYQILKSSLKDILHSFKVDI